MVKVALVSANLTLLTFERLVPVITTEVPTGPLVGEKDEMVGAAVGVTSKLVELVAVFGGLTTEIGPSVAPDGTVAVICVSEFTANVASVPLNSTRFAPVNPLPVITTEVPTGPLVGLNEVIAGAARAPGAITSATA